jgi:bifunctional DNase/RNase
MVRGSYPMVRPLANAALARTGTHRYSAATPMIEMEISRVLFRDDDDHQFVFLKEKTGERGFPIVIGSYEAAEIRRKLKDQAMQRPLTHDLIGRVLRTLGWRLERIVVNDLKQDTFFALLVLQNGEQTEEVDCRPSDAIALALQVKCPIFVEESVLDSVSQS